MIPLLLVGIFVFRDLNSSVVRRGFGRVGGTKPLRIQVSGGILTSSDEKLRKSGTASRRHCMFS